MLETLHSLGLWLLQEQQAGGWDIISLWGHMGMLARLVAIILVAKIGRASCRERV